MPSYLTVALIHSMTATLSMLTVYLQLRAKPIHRTVGDMLVATADPRWSMMANLSSRSITEDPVRTGAMAFRQAYWYSYGKE